MKYTYPVEEYPKQYKEYVEMEKVSFNKDDTKEYILNKLEENAKKKLVMADISNTMINEYIKPFENNIDSMSEEDANILQSFLDSFDVQLQLLDSGYVDYSILLLVARILVKYYRKTGNFAKYLTAVRRTNVGFSITYLSHGYIFDGEHPNYDYIMEIAEHIDDNNGEYKPAILPTVINLLYRTYKTYPLDFYKKVKDFIFKYSKDVNNSEIFEFFYILRALEYFREYVVYNKKQKKDVDIDVYKPFLKEVNSAAIQLLESNKLDQRNAVSLKQNISITKFFLGENTAEQTLNDLEAVTIEEENSSDELLAFNGTTFCNHLYLTFLYYLSGYSKKDIYLMSQKKIKETMPKIVKFRKSTSDFTVNYMTLTFVQSASFTSTFEEFKETILNATVYADKALFIHTVMVKEMAGVIFDYMIEHNPSFFEGVMNKDVQYIINHKEEMKNLLQECCMFHDIGKFFMIDVVENSMRKLTDDEFELIKRHPILFDDVYTSGENEDEKFKCIRDVAHTHHLWHDGTRGYPSEFKQTNNRPFTDILAVVDSIDAATDFLGRPYNAGKTIDQLIHEFLAKSGTQYGEEVCNVLSAPEIKNQLEYWVSEGRKEIYYKVYSGQKI